MFHGGLNQLDWFSMVVFEGFKSSNHPSNPDRMGEPWSPYSFKDRIGRAKKPVCLGWVPVPPSHHRKENEHRPSHGGIFESHIYIYIHMYVCIYIYIRKQIHWKMNKNTKHV